MPGLSQWKHIMIDMGLEPTSVHTLGKIKPYYRKHVKSMHPDKCVGCSSEHKAELTSQLAEFQKSFGAVYGHSAQIEPVQQAFNDYLHTNTTQYFPNTDISVEGNELLLGKIYYAFGLDNSF